MATTFKPIDGQALGAGTTTVFTSAADNTIITSLKALVPNGGTGGVTTIHRVPDSGSVSNATIIASKTLAAEEEIELKNIFLDTGDTIQVVTAAAGPTVVSGNYSEP
jgi:hypothetical protein